tara:strand:- start:661 stop:1338 length:678 start_codon:yes stop_codon:yes gene_type:complete
MKVVVVNTYTFYFFFIFLLISCTIEKTNADQGIEEVPKIIHKYTYEINEINKDDLFHYCCDKKIKGLVPLISVKVSYFNIEGEIKKGELIVNQEIAEEVVDIFRDIYECRFPIAKINPVHFYNCNDDKSMEDNNTSCFNYRTVTGTRKLSDHAFGRAIDINPLFNPFVTRRKVVPVNGEKYVDRQINQLGLIQKNDCVVNAFKSRGWRWGGDWKYKKDYQHFYKY